MTIILVIALVLILIFWTSDRKKLKITTERLDDSLDNNAKVTGIHFDVPNNDFWFEELDAKRISSN